MIASCKGEGISPRNASSRVRETMPLNPVDLDAILLLPSASARNGPYLHCLCSRGPTRGSNASAAETTIGHDAKRDQTTALRSLRGALCAEVKRIVHPAAFYFSRSSLPS